MQVPLQITVRDMAHSEALDKRIRGKAAGPERNRRMLDTFKPDGVIAFPGGRGTADCCRAADERAIPVWRPPADR